MCQWGHTTAFSSRQLSVRRDVAMSVNNPLLVHYSSQHWYFPSVSPDLGALSELRTETSLHTCVACFCLSCHSCPRLLCLQKGAELIHLDFVSSLIPWHPSRFPDWRNLMETGSFLLPGQQAFPGPRGQPVVMFQFVTLQSV